VLDALLVESSILLDTGHSVQRAAIIPAISRRARRPSDLAYSFTSMDSESEIAPEGNPKLIQNGRKPL